MGDVKGCYRTNRVVSVFTEHTCIALAKGENVEILEQDVVFDKILVKIGKFTRKWVDGSWKSNLIKN